jgi:hypothetical protein
MNKIPDIIWSIFVMVCLTTTILYIAWSFYDKQSVKYLPEQEELIEIKKL